MTSNVPVVTIDGPGGSGKGTVGQLLAARQKWHFLDSGALYRAVGLLARERGVAFDDGPGLAAIAHALEPRFVPQSKNPVQIYVDKRDIGDQLRTETAGDAASKVAAMPLVRQALLDKQRALRRPPGLVADGRDMGAVVFPDAILKVYLMATPEIRAERRYKQLKEKGFNVNLRAVLDEIRERDARDAARAASPLKPAVDAYVLDTSNLAIPEVVDRIEGLLHERPLR